MRGAGLLPTLPRLLLPTEAGGWAAEDPRLASAARESSAPKIPVLKPDSTSPHPHGNILDLVPVLLLLGAGDRVAEVPGLDDPALGGVDVSLVLDMADTDAHAVLGEDDVLAGHLVACLPVDLIGGFPDVVADEGDATQDHQHDKQGQDLAVREATC